ncbi:AMP-binding protein [Bacillus sp. V5-8f]|uniref:AMP-binding protein n=1 Tax=Bacillus sp. V5-8f TaxID=2053044 RepID=UPI000C75EBD7|nr:AMP-binding protein [Bacillus sp. V5-8f]PLT33496.1 AMP-dependent synthetase [Bacillus sp. V5-8f]
MTKPVWFPTEEMIQSSRLFRLMKDLGFEDYNSFYQASIRDIQWFWKEAEKAMAIEWSEPYHQVLNLSKGVKWPDWYVGGKLNITHNSLHKWLGDEETADRLALIWEREDGKVEKYTYRELAKWVDRVANGLKKQGVQQGDRIAIYLPMIPETVCAVLAIAKIGAIFVPSYSGFGADPVAARIDGAKAKIVITADGFLRKGRVIEMKEEADKALGLVDCVEKVIVVRRLGREIPWNETRDLEWSQLELEDSMTECEAMDSSDPFMILYTSGTTGRPKGTVHTHAGFTVKGGFDSGYGMNIGKGDVHFWVTDMGWIMGPFLVFGSLLNGATMVVYEGAPDFPANNRLWKLVEDNRVTLLGISPTLIRSLMPHGDGPVKKHDLSSLKSIASTGEPWNPAPWNWLYEKVGKGRLPILNVSGGTEIGGGILTNTILRPITPTGFNTPLPGMDAEVFDQNGSPVREAVGELVIRQPWVGMTNGFWEDSERYENTYYHVWENTWVHGDAVTRDENGFWTIVGRSDDIFNIAGKRIGPAEIESILISHPAVRESAAVGVPDDIKGEAAICFTVLNDGFNSTEALALELNQLVSERLGKSLAPREIHFVSDLPKTRSAKVMRRVIRALYLGTDPGDLSSLDNPLSMEEFKKLML